MIIVLATTFYVRTIKTKLDTKVDAMFQLVQSLVNEVNQLKSTQVAPSTPKEVIQLDINSSNKLVVSENEHSAGEDSDDEDSDDESYDDSSGSENDEDFLKKTVQITNDSPHEVNMHSDVIQEVIQEVAQELVQTVDLQEVDLQEVDLQIKSVQLDATESSEISFDTLNVKELKELVIKKGGKVTGKKKNDLIEFLLS
jgi:hypothetical protein